MTKTAMVIIGIVALAAIACAMIFLGPPDDLSMFKQDDAELNLIRGCQRMQLVGLRKSLNIRLGEERTVDTIIMEFDVNYSIRVKDITELMSIDFDDMPKAMGQIVKPRTVTMVLRGYEVR